WRTAVRRELAHGAAAHRARERFTGHVEETVRELRVLAHADGDAPREQLAAGIGDLLEDEAVAVDAQIGPAVRAGDAREAARAGVARDAIHAARPADDAPALARLRVAVPR